MLILLRYETPFGARIYDAFLEMTGAAVSGAVNRRDTAIGVVLLTPRSTHLDSSRVALGSSTSFSARGILDLLDGSVGRSP